MIVQFSFGGVILDYVGQNGNYVLFNSVLGLQVSSLGFLSFLLLGSLGFLF